MWMIYSFYKSQNAAENKNANVSCGIKKMLGLHMNLLLSVHLPDYCMVKL